MMSPSPGGWQRFTTVSVIRWLKISIVPLPGAIASSTPASPATIPAQAPAADTTAFGAIRLTVPLRSSAMSTVAISSPIRSIATTRWYGRASDATVHGIGHVGGDQLPRLDGGVRHVERTSDRRVQGRLAAGTAPRRGAPRRERRRRCRPPRTGPGSPPGRRASRRTSRRCPRCSSGRSAAERGSRRCTREPPGDP